MEQITIPRRTEHSEATRRALIEAARGLFAERGYAATSIDQIVRRARVTKGALYHHFSDKRQLFAAVCEEVERSWVEEMAAEVAAEPDPRMRLEMGCDAYLDACLDPAMQRILVIDAPAVLGSEELRGLDVRFGLGLLRVGLDDAMAAGYLEEQPAEPLAHLLLGALNEAGLAIAQAEHPDATRAQLGASLARMIEGLRPGA